MIVVGAAKCRYCNAILDPRLKGKLANTNLQSIPNYLVQSILVTLFCCLPFGIVAIVYAAQVNARVQAGDIQAAISASNNAKMWSWISFGIWMVGFVLYFLVVFATVLMH